MRILAVSGVNLDRAWPELGRTAGRARRERATQLLVELVRTARDHDVDAIAIVGGLCDRRTVMPSTLELAGTAFSSFEGPILVVPGSLDWHSDDGPYANTSWPANVHIFGVASADVELDASVTVTGVGAGPTGSPGRLSPPSSGSTYTLAVVASGEEVAGEEVRGRLGGSGYAHVLTNASETVLADGLTAVAPLLPAAGRVPGSGVVLELGDNVLERTEIDVTEGGGTTYELDAGRYATTAELVGQIRSAMAGLPPASVVALTGTLRAGVMLPAVAGEDLPRTDVLLDTSALGYEASAGEPSDASSRSEFIRSLSDVDGTDDEHHQALALGLAALEADR